VKAVLRGEAPPFSSDELSSMMSGVEAQAREVKRLSRLSERYWTLEWFRQQPKQATWRALLLKYLKEDDLLGLILIYEVREKEKEKI
jgi:exoribonuclease R